MISLVNLDSTGSLRVGLAARGGRDSVGRKLAPVRCERRTDARMELAQGDSPVARLAALSDPLRPERAGAGVAFGSSERHVAHERRPAPARALQA